MVAMACHEYSATLPDDACIQQATAFTVFCRIQCLLLLRLCSTRYSNESSKVGGPTPHHHKSAGHCKAQFQSYHKTQKDFLSILLFIRNCMWNHRHPMEPLDHYMGSGNEIWQPMPHYMLVPPGLTCTAIACRLAAGYLPLLSAAKSSSMLVVYPASASLAPSIMALHTAASLPGLTGWHKYSHTSFSKMDSNRKASLPAFDSSTCQR